MLFDPEFLDGARERLDENGRWHGADGDVQFVVLDGLRYDMAVLDCTPSRGLAAAVDALAAPPAVVMNAQFIGSALRRRHEGQIVRNGRLVSNDPRESRWYVAQVDDETGMSRFRVRRGNPWHRESRLFAALGGLGGLIEDGAAAPITTPFARSLYDAPADTGRGIVGFDHQRNLILVIVQPDRRQLGGPVRGARTLTRMREALIAMGVRDAIFNDGSDSEALAVDGEWAVEPATSKSLATAYALAFTNRDTVRRPTVVALDGTPTADARILLEGLSTAPAMLHRFRNVANDLKTSHEHARLADANRSGVLQTWRLASVSGARQFQTLFGAGRVDRRPLDLVYVSGHATRHGELNYHRYGGLGGPAYVTASVWDRGMKFTWDDGPRWLVLAGCAVLALRYSRLVGLSGSEITGLVQRHRDIHGEKALVSGLADKDVAWEVYHPGWAWYSKVFQSSAVRGVLGYWYRSPGAKGGDVEILRDFVDRLSSGSSFLDAWSTANKRGLFDAPAAWAAMVRAGCEDDGLQVFEDATLRRAHGAFHYYDAYQPDGNQMGTAFQRANTTDTLVRVGETGISAHSFYDRVTLASDPDKLAVPPDGDNLLRYDDGVGP